MLGQVNFNRQQKLDIYVISFLVLQQLATVLPTIFDCAHFPQFDYIRQMINLITNEKSHFLINAESLINDPLH